MMFPSLKRYWILQLSNVPVYLNILSSYAVTRDLLVNRLWKLRGFIPHIKSRGEEKTGQKHNPEYKARRWAVEVTRSWMNRFRKLLVRFEKLTASYLGLLMLACAFIAFRKANVI
jgi:hypothetical protein